MVQKETPKKSYYDVVIEIVSPITIKYRVYAEDAKQAVEIVEKGRANAPIFISKPKIHPNKLRSVIVYLAGTVMKLFSYSK